MPLNYSGSAIWMLQLIVVASAGSPNLNKSFLNQDSYEISSLSHIVTPYINSLKE